MSYIGKIDEFLSYKTRNDSDAEDKIKSTNSGMPVHTIFGKILQFTFTLRKCCKYRLDSILETTKHLIQQVNFCLSRTFPKDYWNMLSFK